MSVRLAWYGDDLTGSTDVMEALSLHGIRSVLFTSSVPGDVRARYPWAEAVGLAGHSRSETPDWMEAVLPGAFAGLRASGAALLLYKVCSTFDSAPEVGSIGRAIEIGRRVCGARCVPLVVGAPELRRWTVFATLFAAAIDGRVYRIDRHPVMSRHPVTPMTEADLLVHLGRQTSLRLGCVDQVALLGADGNRMVDEAARTADVLLLDVADAASQRAAGRQIERLAASGCGFVAGSSGVVYALAASGETREAERFAPVGAVGPIAVVSGSMSGTTEAQIRRAEAAGFVRIAVEPADLQTGAGNAMAEAKRALAGGRSVVLHTALGPAADRAPAAAARHAVGRGLGRLLAALVREAGLRRAVVAGGDTSSHALAEMGIEALTMRHALRRTPGSPLCTAHAAEAAFDGLEIAFKGGQVGDEGYFVALRDGVPASA